MVLVPVIASSAAALLSLFRWQLWISGGLLGLSAVFMWIPEFKGQGAAHAAGLKAELTECLQPSRMLLIGQCIRSSSSP